MEKLLLFVLLAGLPVFLKAQEEEVDFDSRSQARETMQMLKTGVLIVRLPSNRNKLEALHKSLENPELKPKQRKRLNRILQNTIKEGEEDNLITIGAFREKYKFSEVYFVYDTSSASLGKGIEKGYFLNDSLQIDPDKTIAGKVWFTLRVGYSDAIEHIGETFVITDSSLRDLPAPFPGIVRYRDYNIFSIIPTPKKIAIEKAVKRLDKRFKSFAG